jgi:hypothetical protein
MRLQVTVPLQRGGSFVSYLCKDTATLIVGKNMRLQAIKETGCSFLNEPFDHARTC